MLVLGICGWGLLRGRGNDVYRALGAHDPAARRSSPRSRPRLRRRPGAADGQAAADEDGRGRGALQHDQGRGLLAVRRRPVRAPPAGTSTRHPHPAPAVAARDAELERHGPGHQPGQRRRAEEVRPGRLHADRRRDLLELPADGRRRRAADPVRADRHLADAPPRPARAHALVQPRSPSSAIFAADHRQLDAAGSSPRWAASRGSSTAC